MIPNMMIKKYMLIREMINQTCVSNRFLRVEIKLVSSSHGARSCAKICRQVG